MTCKEYEVKCSWKSLVIFCFSISTSVFAASPSRSGNSSRALPTFETRNALLVSREARIQPYLEFMATYRLWYFYLFDSDYVSRVAHTLAEAAEIANSLMFDVMNKQIGSATLDSNVAVFLDRGSNFYKPFRGTGPGSNVYLSQLGRSRAASHKLKYFTGDLTSEREGFFPQSMLFEVPADLLILYGPSYLPTSITESHAPLNLGKMINPIEAPRAVALELVALALSRLESQNSWIRSRSHVTQGRRDGAVAEGPISVLIRLHQSRFQIPQSVRYDELSRMDFARAAARLAWQTAFEQKRIKTQPPKTTPSLPCQEGSGSNRKICETHIDKSDREWAFSDIFQRKQLHSRFWQGSFEYSFLNPLSSSDVREPTEREILPDTFAMGSHILFGLDDLVEKMNPSGTATFTVRSRYLNVLDPTVNTHDANKLNLRLAVPCGSKAYGELLVSILSPINEVPACQELPHPEIESADRDYQNELEAEKRWDKFLDFIRQGVSGAGGWVAGQAYLSRTKLPPSQLSQELALVKKIAKSRTGYIKELSRFLFNKSKLLTTPAGREALRASAFRKLLLNSGGRVGMALTVGSLVYAAIDQLLISAEGLIRHEESVTKLKEYNLQERARLYSIVNSESTSLPDRIVGLQSLYYGQRDNFLLAYHFKRLREGLNSIGHENREGAVLSLKEVAADFFRLPSN